MERTYKDAYEKLKDENYVMKYKLEKQEKINNKLKKKININREYYCYCF